MQSKDSLNPAREILQVLGGLIQNPTLLKDKKYKLASDDFPKRFHKIIFGSIHNLINQGVKDIDEIAIDNYISNYPEQYEIFTQNDGFQYIINAKDKANLANFDYNYERIKKFSLLRHYDSQGIDISGIYDDTIVALKAQQKMQEDFDELSVHDIIKYFKEKILMIEKQFEENDNSQEKKAGDGALQQKEKFKKEPLMGLSFESKMLTTVARGMRKKMFVIRSSDTGGGKSRTSIGDLCCWCAKELWDDKLKQFIRNPNGQNNGGLYIGTEMDLTEEVEPIFWAYISGVPTDRILDGKYLEGEEERVDRAIEILQESNIWLVDEPEFNSQTLERHIDFYTLTHNINWVVFDYIQLTDSLIQEEVIKKKGMGIREDQVLIGLSKLLKNLCKKYNVGLLSMTQVNADISDYKKRDYTIIRGGKGVADKADLGIVAMPPVKAELELVDPILKQMKFTKKPNLVYTVYKGRFSKYPKEIKIWQYVDFGTMRAKDLFCTTKNYEYVEVEKTIVNVLDEEEKEDEIDF